ncbi:MAG: MmgE/PrpD family protein [Chloroflexi bacterium]|nr:MmgE/PrpD family protein [Chloroflexota bacterium]
MEKPTQRLLNFAMQTSFEDLPEQVVQAAKLAALDTIGISLAALQSEKGRLGLAMANRFGGPPESGILGTGQRVSCGAAAFANGELANALDWDAYQGTTHALAVVIPALLPLAEMAGASGKDLVLATALGLEISSRLGRSIRGHKLVFDTAEGSEVGKIPGTKYSVTAVGCAVIAAAAGAGRMLKLDREKISHAVGLAGHFSPIPMTKWKYEPVGPMTKYMCSGWASIAVTTAVQLADMGYTGDKTVLDGEIGYWRYFGSDRWDPDTTLGKLGRDWVFPAEVEYKRYPCCAVYTVFLDCFARIIDDNRLLPHEIEKIRIQSGPWASPPPLSGKVESHIQAQFHPMYLLACIAHRISRSSWQDEDSIRDPEIEKFMERVPLLVEDHPDSQNLRLVEPRSNMTVVEVVARGKTFKQDGKYHKFASDAESSILTAEDLIEQFALNASKILPEEKVGRAIEYLMGLEKVQSVAEVIREVTL